ncbi:hypothetical protein M8J75_008850 [Diaphorina citri]|nr:hypothetical protein M8J75_008850 [Diaphorina citri]
MSSLEAKRLYYDTNTGLMPIIQALIAPPVTEEDIEHETRARREKKERKQEKKEGLDLHPYYKKRGRSHNHDYCDACLEGGNLLCCDTCEASFHLECNDPPLHVDEIPLDMWQCRRCTKLHKESPSKKQNSSPAKQNSKRRKSTNSNNSASSNHFKKLRSVSGQDSDEEAGISSKPSGGNNSHYNNHMGGGRGTNDSGDSDISSISVTRRRGRPRKHPLNTPLVPKSAVKPMNNQSDSDSESLLSTRTKRFMKRRKREPSKHNVPGTSGNNNGSNSTSSDEGQDHSNTIDTTLPSSSNQNTNSTGKSRVGPNANAPPTRLTPNKLDRGMSGPIGYLKYSSSEDEDSTSEKSLYFRDMIEENKTTEEYLDENTGEIVTRSLCENEYLSKLLSKKNTTSEIDDIERINELLLKTENMRMDSNIIKKIIGCSIPEPSEQSDDEHNAYDSDEDERTSEEEMREKYLDMSDDTAPTDPPVSNDSAVPPVSINDVNNDTGVTQVQNNIHSPSASEVQLPDDNDNEARNNITSITPAPHVSIQLTEDKQPDKSEGIENQVKCEADDKEEAEEEKVDEELCSLLKFNKLWTERFGGEETREEEEGESDSYEEYSDDDDDDDEEEEEEEEEEEHIPVETMDVKPESLSITINTTDVADSNELCGTLKSDREQHVEEKSLDDVVIDWTDKENEVEVRNAMQILLSAAAHSNPEQFTLGKYEDKSYDKYVWPGTDKIPDNVKITSKRVRSLLNLIEVDSDGLVPHPVKICHSCGRTCFRTGPLLGCDYCPLYYHLDCLDPPLASPPTLTWMCPAHPQHIVDQMLTQGGVVERSEAWDAWALRSVNEEQVTKEFLTKVRTGDQRHTIKRNRLSAKIPGFISHHYRRPPSLAPSLQEAIQLEAVSHNRNTMGSSREDKEQFLQSLLALESQLLLLSYENKTSPLSVSAPLPIPPDDIKSTDQTKHKPKEKSSASNSLLPEVMEMVLSSSTPGQEMVLSSSTPGQEMVLSSSTPGQETEDKLDSYFRFGEDFVTPAVPVSNHHESETLTNFKIDDINPNNFKVEDLFITTTTTTPTSLSLNHTELSPLLGKKNTDPNDDDDDKCLDKSIEEEIVSLDEVVKEEEEEKEKIKEEEKEGEEEKKTVKQEDEGEMNSEISLKKSLLVKMNELLRNAKLTTDDTNNAIIDLSDVRQLHPALVQVLALERIAQLTSHQSPQVLPQPRLPHPYAPFIPQDTKPPTRLHAQLCPLTRKMGPIPMTTNWLTIGLGSTSNVDLSKFGLCSKVSPRHAVIFYEMASNTYELINVSEFGSRVDNISYVPDPSLSSHHYRSAHYTTSSAALKSKWRTLVSERIKQSPFLMDVKTQRLRVKEGMERRKKRRRRRRAGEDEDSEEQRMPLHYGQTVYKCSCISDEEGSDEEYNTTSRSKASTKHTGRGWESTCLVRHGSLLQFGCFKFVFSITEPTRPPLPMPSDQRSIPEPAKPSLHNKGILEEGASSKQMPLEECKSIKPDVKSSISGPNGLNPGVKESSPHFKEAMNQQVPSSEHNKPSRVASSGGGKKEFKTTKRKPKSTKVKKPPRGGNGASGTHSSPGSSTDTCSENEEFEPGEKD